MGHSINPSEPNVISTAMYWLEGTLLGSVAITIAVIAVAWVGFQMLTGRIDVRRGLRVVVGCFILFGAASLATGIQAAISRVSGGPQPQADAVGDSSSGNTAIPGQNT